MSKVLGISGFENSIPFKKANWPGLEEREYRISQGHDSAAVLLVDGEVVAINEKLLEDPTPVTTDPYGEGWLIKVKVEPGTRLDHLMTLEQYKEQIASEGH